MRTKFAKLAGMVDFLKGEIRPFTAIAREAVRRGIIKKDETSKLSCFTVCVGRVGDFMGVFFPGDQTPTQRDRWEWKLKADVTKESFRKEIYAYIKKHFKTA
jgi:hypothetical protein